ncbi:MAG: hypothetical protein BAA02_04460 [Paenibacillaceae bacterium ZCTH02-B3]|nr:MAG: hypothetical protein BAA02_04460 [Paenibacillaceae bacterium ZCTH02-B3]
MPVTNLLRADGLSFDQAAMLEPLAIGAHAVRRSGAGEGQTVLVIGAGPIGLGVMVFARLAGARVLAMDVSGERLAFCRTWAGVEHSLDAAGLAAPQMVKRLAELTDGEFPAVVIDATGNAGSMTDAFGYLAHGGTLVFVGLTQGSITFSHPEFHKRETTLMASRNATREDFDRVLRAVKNGTVDIGRYITHRAKHDDMIERFAHWLRPESNVIKAVVEWP